MAKNSNLDWESIKKGASIAVPFVVGTTSLLIVAVPTLAVLLTVCPALPVITIVFACVGFTVFGAACLYKTRGHSREHLGSTLNYPRYFNPLRLSKYNDNTQKCFTVAMVGDVLLAFGAIVLFTTAGGALLIPPVAGAVLMGVGALLLLYAAIEYIDSERGRTISSFMEKLAENIFSSNKPGRKVYPAWGCLS